MKINWSKVGRIAKNVALFAPRLIVAPLVVPVMFYLRPLISLLVGIVLVFVTGRWHYQEPTFLELTKVWLWPSF